MFISKKQKVEYQLSEPGKDVKAGRGKDFNGFRNKVTSTIVQHSQTTMADDDKL